MRTFKFFGDVIVDENIHPTPIFDRPHPIRAYDEIIIDMIDYCAENTLILTGYDRDVDNDLINIRVENVSRDPFDDMVSIEYRVYHRLTTNLSYHCLRMSFSEWRWRFRVR